MFSQLLFYVNTKEGMRQFGHVRGEGRGVKNKDTSLKKTPPKCFRGVKNAPEAAVWWRRGQKNWSCMWLSPHFPEAHVGKHCWSARMVCPRASPMQISNPDGRQQQESLWLARLGGTRSLICSRGVPGGAVGSGQAASPALTGWS